MKFKILEYQIIQEMDQDIWRIIQGYFENEDLASIQKDSFDFLVTHTIPDMISSTTFVAPVSSETSLLIRFGNVYIDKPRDISKNLIYPYQARYSDLTYEATVYVDVFTKLFHTITKDVLDVQSYPYTMLFRLPVMTRSVLCNLHDSPEHHNESPDDFGGYFIVKGNERVIVSQERINTNSIYVFEDKKTRSDYVAEIRSLSRGGTVYAVLITARLINGNILITLPKKCTTADIPLGIILRALGADLNDVMRWFEPFPFAKNTIKKSIHRYANLSTDDAIAFISRHTNPRVPETKRVRHTIQILENQLFPHLGIYATMQSKAYFVCLLVLRLLQVHFGHRHVDDRDHVNNKRIEMSGDLIGNLLHELFKKRFIRFVQQTIEKKGDTNILGIIQKFNLTNRIYHCFSTGNWGVQKSSYIRKGVTQILNRLSYSGTISHLRRIVVPIEKNSKNTDVRHLHASTYGFTCSIESPEGQSAGIVKSLAMIVKISYSISTIMVMDTIVDAGVDIVDFSLGKTALMVNGTWFGCVDNVVSTLGKLKELRRCGLLHWSISIGYDCIDNEIQIHSDSGRLLRPVFDLKCPRFWAKLQELCNQHRNDPKQLWNALQLENIIVWVDGYEVDFAHVAMTMEEIITDKDELENSEFLEIHPSLMLGSCANTIPFPEHSQAPRLIYSSAMMKQAIGMYAQNYITRYDTLAHVLHYPQKRIVNTKYSEFCKMDENPSGVNLIVAIACYTGFNQEDSVIINKSAIDRGLFHSTSYKTTSISEAKRGTHGKERIEIPPKELQKKDLDYSCLDENGIVKKGSKVTVDHVLVGRVFYLNEEPKEDTSLMCEPSEQGIVDEVLETINANGYKHVKIRIRKLRIPEVGDKVAQLSAQKGTIGAVYRQEDMPWGHSSQMVPDLIINPHSQISRMTINMLMEMLCGKECAITGHFQDATAFCHSDELVESVGDILTNHGYDQHGDEIFYNGFTGEPFKMKIFMGVCYYQRLKHLVDDKIHARGGRGGVQNLTHQPLEGRSKDGGLRFGEMERDCMISHGASIYLKERMHDTSDPYQVHVCERCGHILDTIDNPCPLCNSDKSKLVSMPYSSKLLMQELNAMGIKVSIE